MRLIKLSRHNLCEVYHTKKYRPVFIQKVFTYFSG
jgi:hypothetical protein